MSGTAIVPFKVCTVSLLCLNHFFQLKSSLPSLLPKPALPPGPALLHESTHAYPVLSYLPCNAFLFTSPISAYLSCPSRPVCKVLPPSNSSSCFLEKSFDSETMKGIRMASSFKHLILRMHGQKAILNGPVPPYSLGFRAFWEPFLKPSTHQCHSRRHSAWRATLSYDRDS